MTVPASPPAPPDRASDPANAIAALLAPYLGPNAAREALRDFCTRALAISPESLTWSMVPSLAASLQPAMRTLLGTEAADRLTAELLAMGQVP